MSPNRASPIPFPEVAAIKLKKSAAGTSSGPKAAAVMPRNIRSISLLLLNDASHSKRLPGGYLPLTNASFMPAITALTVSGSPDISARARRSWPEPEPGSTQPLPFTQYADTWNGTTSKGTPTSSHTCSNGPPMPMREPPVGSITFWCLSDEKRPPNDGFRSRTRVL